MGRALTSAGLSLLVSAAATYLLRRALSVEGAPDVEGRRRQRPYSTVVIVVPILVGNSNNHIWHRERGRGLFDR